MREVLSWSGWHRTVELRCTAVSSDSVCAAERGDSHHLVPQLFQLHRIAALAAISVQTPCPFLTACQFHMHHRPGKLQDGVP